ncbi:MAG: tyrosine-type recombinase/integrase [Desulfomonilaceae bacterium]
MSGLVKRGETWHIEKRFRGSRIRESCGTSDLEEAERYLVHRLEQIRQAEIYGVRPKRSFRQAATKYLKEATKASIADDAMHLKFLEPFIGTLSLEAVHMGTLQPFIQARKAKGVKARTINYGIQTVRHILNLAAGEWLDENGMTWLATMPRIKFLPEVDKRTPYPLSWDEQFRLLNQLPRHLAKMTLFKVNTGCREAEVCGLKWEWEDEIPELNMSVFVIPADWVKNRKPRIVILNRIARAVIEEMRGVHPEYVFTYKGGRIRKMNGPAWRKARQRAGLPLVRVHDLKHTFGRRLRAAGVSFEDRQDLLGHKSGRITTHYSQAELENLIAAANKVCGQGAHKMPTLVMLKEKNRLCSAKQPGGFTMKAVVGATGFEPATT